VIEQSIQSLVAAHASTLFPTSFTINDSTNTSWHCVFDSITSSKLHVETNAKMWLDWVSDENQSTTKKCCVKKGCLVDKLQRQCCSSCGSIWTHPS